MDEQNKKGESPAEEVKPANKNDSLGIPVEKSPWLIYALLQIPIVLIMVALLYFAYQRFKENGG